MVKTIIESDNFRQSKKEQLRRLTAYYSLLIKEQGKMTEDLLSSFIKARLCETLMEVPFVSNVEIIQDGSAARYSSYCVEIFFADSEDTESLFVEVKSRGERRFVNAFINQISDCRKDENYLLAVPYISEESGEIMRQNELSYLDLSGNCYIYTGRVFIYVSGKKNEFVESKSHKKYFDKTSSAASAIMRTMLNNPHKIWHVKELSDMTGKALGTVSNVKRFLADNAWIEELSNGFKLCDMRGLLYNWANDYRKKNDISFEYYSLDSIPIIENRIAEWNAIHGASATLGCFAAAVRYAPVVRYNKVHVYVTLTELEAFVSELELKKVNSGGNVIINIPHDDTSCMFSRLINGDVVTSPVQTVIDLLMNNGRGEEAADEIIKKEFEGVDNY